MSLKIFTKGEKLLLLFLIGGTLLGFILHMVTEVPGKAKLTVVENSRPNNFPVQRVEENTPEAEKVVYSKKTLKKVDVKIDINAAGVEELVGLPGIGRVVADRIVKYRKLNGRFATKEALLGVNGIGKAKLEKISPLITIE
jgi:competence protein ComEA